MANQKQRYVKMEMTIYLDVPAGEEDNGLQNIPDWPIFRAVIDQAQALTGHTCTSINAMFMGEDETPPWG